MAPDDPNPKPNPGGPYRMRRLTGDEMDHLCALARQGRTGPAAALRQLWDLILRDAEGVSYDEAADQPGKFSVDDYAIDQDQLKRLHEAMLVRRRLNRRDLNLVAMLWLDQSPPGYGPEEA